MATGYTHGLTAETTLREFALSCARAFGALIEMRDDPADSPIKLPEASDYHPKALIKAERELVSLLQMDAAACEAAAAAEFEQATARFSDGRAKMKALRLVYRNLIANVEGWQPPTSEHQGLKKFMLEQLRESDKWDNGSLDRPSKLPVKETGEQWLASCLQRTRRDITYHAEEWQKEQARVAERCQWVLDLQASLPTP